ncbi:hypothetical protein K504DRAFT_462166, partial [Pleomassaria siparia CBS 279.74]
MALLDLSAPSLHGGLRGGWSALTPPTTNIHSPSPPQLKCVAEARRRALLASTTEKVQHRRHISARPCQHRHCHCHCPIPIAIAIAISVAVAVAVTVTVTVTPHHCHHLRLCLEDIIVAVAVYASPTMDTREAL